MTATLEMPCVCPVMHYRDCLGGETLDVDYKVLYTELDGDNFGTIDYVDTDIYDSPELFKLLRGVLEMTR